MHQFKEVEQAEADSGATLEDWLRRFKPFYAGQKHLIEQVRSAGIRNTYEIIHLLEQAKTFVGVANPSSLSSELNECVITLAREIRARRGGERRLSDARKLRKFGLHEAINDVPLVGEVRSILGMKKTVMASVGEIEYNSVQVLHGLFIVWKVMEALRFYVDREYENFGISLLLASRCAYAAKKISWIISKPILTKATLTKLSKQGVAARLIKDPKQADKARVKGYWERWQTEPNLYDTQEMFAIDMLEKFGKESGRGSLTSISTIMKKWIPEFRGKTNKK